jgi:hypothetical protein
MKIRYSEIMNLPDDHPKSIEFMRQLNEQDKCYGESFNGHSVLNDEDSVDYFNKFVAGDRK